MRAFLSCALITMIGLCSQFAFAIDDPPQVIHLHELSRVIDEDPIPLPPPIPGPGERRAWRCAGAVTKTALRCTQFNSRKANFVVKEIKQLLVRNRPNAKRQAHALTRRCARVINRKSDRAIKAINHLCGRCIDRLLNLDRPDLARRIHVLCADKAKVIKDSQREALAMIRSALSDAGMLLDAVSDR